MREPAKVPTIPRYEILHEISHGGQGIIYQAVQQSTKRKVAIKVLLEGVYASRAARRRFEREIELVASLKHPNIIAVFDSGVTPEGHQFYVMDYIRGVPIDEYVRQKEMGVEEVLTLFRTVCEAVNHAHQKGVIHRDLKPSNILVDSDGAPRILDFGLAKTVSESTDSLVSITGQVVGTLPYMSPEQTRGNPDAVDVRTDVYALGVILYRILTGSFPYPIAATLSETVQNIAELPPAPLSRTWTHGSGIKNRVRKPVRRLMCPLDKELDTLIQKCLAKERTRRYQSAGEFSRDIGHYLAGEPLDAKRDSTFYLLSKAYQRHKLRFGIAAAFAALIVGSVIGLSILYARQSRLLEEVRREGEAARAAELRTNAARADESKQRKLAQFQLQLNRLSVARAAVEQKDFTTARKILVEARVSPDLADDWHWAAWSYVRASGEVSAKDIVGWFPEESRGRLLRGGGLTYPVTLDTDRHRIIVGPYWYTSGNPPSAPHLNFYSIDLNSGTNLPIEISKENPLELPGLHIELPAQLLMARNRELILRGHFRFSMDANLSTPTISLTDETDAGKKCTLSVFQEPNCCALSHDQSKVVVGFRTGKIVGYEVSTDGPRPVLTQAFLIPGYREGVGAIAFSADDEQVHAISDGMIYRVWYWNAARDSVQLSGASSTIRHIVFSPDGGRVAAASYDGHVRIYDSHSHKLINDIAAHPASTNFGTIVFFPDSRHLLTCGADSMVRIWDTDARQIRSIRSFFGGTNEPIAEFFVGSTARAELSPDGNTLYATNGFGWLNNNAPITLEKWDLHDLNHPSKVCDFPSTPGIYMAYNIRLIPSLNRLIAVNSSIYGGDESLSSQIFDTSTTPPKALGILDDGHVDHRDLDVSPDNKLLALSTWKGTVSLWDWQDGKRIGNLEVNPGRDESSIVSSVRFHPSLPILVTACHDSRVTLFSTVTFRKLAAIDMDEDRQLSFGPHGALKEAVFSPDGKILAIGAGNDLWLLDLNFFDPQILQLADERPVTADE